MSIDHYPRRPVITFQVKIVYSDDGYSFSLSRSNFPTIILTCIPNGELSQLFDFDIIDNFKTYEYYSESDGTSLKPFSIDKNFHHSVTLKNHCDSEFIGRRGLIDMSDTIGKISYYDVKNKCLWWLVSSSKKKEIAAIKSGSSVRYNNDYLMNRFDSNNNSWIGYKEYKVLHYMP